MLAQEQETSQLRAIAARVCWWQTPEETLQNTPVFLCRVMAMGTWDDATFCLQHFGREAFKDALRSAPPGIIDARSWKYWHLRFGISPIPPMPVRSFPE